MTCFRLSLFNAVSSAGSTAACTMRRMCPRRCRRSHVWLARPRRCCRNVWASLHLCSIVCLLTSRPACPLIVSRSPPLVTWRRLMPQICQRKGYMRRMHRRLTRPIPCPDDFRTIPVHRRPPLRIVFIISSFSIPLHPLSSSHTGKDEFLLSGFRFGWLHSTQTPSMTYVLRIAHW